ncbi:hypothetical protein ACGFJ7_45370 [Actinoplanes sp. NPDC048988]|uniref:hypothetical protein n=1 Tax=Actinoplanes sp. NPDC048988 TaxID=3363901 RepID=UPI0037122EE7
MSRTVTGPAAEVTGELERLLLAEGLVSSPEEIKVWADAIAGPRLFRGWCWSAANWPANAGLKCGWGPHRAGDRWALSIGVPAA